MVMKNALIIAVFLGVSACQNQNSPAPNSLRTNFSAVEGNTITTGFPSFQVLVVSIYDSRCPSDVVCIWGGMASVTFQVGTDEFSLMISQSKKFSVGEKNYELTLNDVTPYPSSKTANEEKKAVFTLKRL